MAESLLQILQKLKDAQSDLRQELENLRQRNKELEEEALNARRDAEEADKRREEALLEVEYLKVSHRLADSPDTSVETRRMIAGLIRNIDRCIAMLKE